MPGLIMRLVFCSTVRADDAFFALVPDQLQELRNDISVLPSGFGIAPSVSVVRSGSRANPSPIISRYISDDTGISRLPSTCPRIWFTRARTALHG